MAAYGVECCPYLGARGDVSSYDPYPVEGAICLSLLRPKGISVNRQEEFCLCASYALCPRLARASRLGGASTLVTSHVPLWVTVGVIFLTVGLAWGVLGLIDRNGRDIPGRSVEVSETEWEKASRAAQGNVQSGGSTSDPNAGPVGSAVATQTMVPAPASVAPSPRPTSAPSPVPSAPAAVKYHDVQPGETLTGIARLYGVTVDALRSANKMGSDDVLRAGARLAVPVAGTVYVVQAGDTLTALAQKNGISLDSLAAANGLPPGSNILIGQQLVIPSR